MIKNYKYKILRKDITVFKNGHGVVSYALKIEVLDNKFDRVFFAFYLDEWTYKYKGVRLKLLEEMRKSQNKNREQAFYIKGSEYKEIKCTQDKENGKEIQIIFNKGQFKKGDIIEFLLVWSTPNLYPNSKEIKEFRKGTLSAISSITPMERVVINVNIERSHPLKEKIFECEKWLNDKKGQKIATLPVKKEKGKLKVEFINVKPEITYLLTYKSKY